MHRITFVLITILLYCIIDTEKLYRVSLIEPVVWGVLFLAVIWFMRKMEQTLFIVGDFCVSSAQPIE
jgi:hypothetical protein